jgi:hypothetical protein
MGEREVLDQPYRLRMCILMSFYALRHTGNAFFGFRTVLPELGNAVGSARFLGISDP